VFLDDSLLTFSFQLLSAKLYVEGYHIHVRDMSSRDATFDVVSIA
jgi:hypothetical protein